MGHEMNKTIFSEKINLNGSIKSQQNDLLNGDQSILNGFFSEKIREQASSQSLAFLREASSKASTPMSRLEGPIIFNSLSADNQIQSSVD